MRSLALVTLFAFSGFAAAEDKAPSGTFGKKVEGFELKVTFQKENTLKFDISSGNDGCKLDAKYTLEKDGTLKCEVTKFEKTGDFPEKEKGYKFSFKAEFKDKVMKVTKFEGDDINDNAKQILEGDYTKE